MLRIASLVAIVAVLGLATGCGDKTVTSTDSQGQQVTQTVPNIHFAKTKFVLHGGLAYGAFQRYIYKPFRAGAFAGDAPGRKKALIKAGLAGTFVTSQLRAMYRDALSDDDLRPIANKITAVLASIPGLVSSLKNGNIDAAGIASTAAGFTAIVDSAKGQGVDIPLDKSPSLSG
jgi:hypothetical protein